MQLSRRQIIAYVAVAVVVVAVGVRYVVLPRQAGPSEAQAVVLAPVGRIAVGAGRGAGGEPGRLAHARRHGLRLRRGAHARRGAAPRRRARHRRARAGRRPHRQGGARRRQPGGAGHGRPADPRARARRGGGRLRAGLIRLLVVERRRRGSAPAGGATPGALVNINTASLEELDSLDGVGPSTAQKIIDYRTENGGFKTVDEIKEVPGIGDAKFAAMKDSITV